jgi:hypothetical protein
MTALARSRLPIRDRTHTREIVRQLAFGDLLKDGGSGEGFADWLFVNRKTFNGRNPLQQVKVYANARLCASKLGEDFDALCRERADQKERDHARVSFEFSKSLAIVKAWWSETPVGADITLAVVELCLGRGMCFSASLDGAAEPQDVWVLEWLLTVLESFGGPEDALQTYEWKRHSAELDFRQYLVERAGALASMREMIFRGQPLTEPNFLCVASCTRFLSRLPRIRTSVRAHLTQALMIERIQAAAPAVRCNSSFARGGRNV